MPLRVQLSRRRGWRKPPGCVVVARPRKWGNPFVVGRDGDAAECVRKFAEDIHHPNSRLGFAPADLAELRGKDLACWCKLGAPCHADVLLEAANSPMPPSGAILTEDCSRHVSTSRAVPAATPEPDPEPEMNAPIKCLHTEVWALDRFVEHPRNPNKHPEGQLQLLAKILQTQGWRNPIVVSRRSGLVIKGHGRLAAARLAGLTEAPVELQDYASEALEVADLVADNRIAELAEADPFALHSLLAELRLDPDFDVMLSGFTPEAADTIAAEVLAASDVTDGISGAATAVVSKLADTTFKFGPLRFEVKREEYLRWQEGIRQAVGFNKAAISKEIGRRLGILTA